MSRCNKCDNKIICNVYKDLCSLLSSIPRGIKIEVSECYFNQDEDIINKDKEAVKNNNVLDISNVIDKALDEVIVNINNNSDKIDEDDISDLKTEDVVINNKTKTLYSCPNCNTQDYLDGLFYCEKCGKLVCKNCGVYDSSTNMNLCEDCW